MSLLDWNGQLKLGHPQIDSDHRKMVELLNRFHDASLAEDGLKVCSLILSDLIAYTRSHFALEEQLMGLIQYAQRDQHQTEHRALIAEIVDRKAGLDRGSASVDAALFDFLKNWVASHIQGSDRALVTALLADSLAQAS